MNRKSTFLTIIFSLLFVSGLLAQEKYEYAVVTYAAQTSKSAIIGITKGSGFQESRVTISEGNAIYNLFPIIEVVNKMSEEGWETYSNSSNFAGATVVYYYLRKKKN